MFKWKAPFRKGVHHTLELALLSYTGWQKRHLRMTGNMKHYHVMYAFFWVIA